MSGRGVITSRTSVSPKSTMLWSSSPLLALDEPFLLAGVEVGRRRLARPLPSLVVGRPACRRAALRDRPRRSSASAGQARGRPALNDGSSSSSTRSGSRPTISSGSSSSKTTTNAATLSDDERQRVRAARRRSRGASSAVAAAVDQAEQQPDRHEQQHRIVEILAERVRAAAALGDQAQRQPHQRAERRLDRAEVDARRTRAGR